MLLNFTTSFLNRFHGPLWVRVAISGAQKNIKNRCKEFKKRMKKQEAQNNKKIHYNVVPARLLNQKLSLKAQGIGSAKKSCS